MSAGANYDITFTRATLTVASAALSITAENQNSTYGSLLVLPQSGGSAYSVLGLKNGDSVSSATVLYSGNQTVPSTTNAGDYSGSVDVSAANGVRLANYNITYVPGNLSVAKAVLTVTAVDSGKFVGMNDPSGYGGVMFSGFKNADSDSSGALGSATVSVSRSNSSVNDAGIYTNVLLPNVSTSLQNYSVTYGSGKFVIVGANQLLVQVGANSTSYGAAPNYSASTMTVSYCTNCALGVSSPNIITVPRADIRVSGSSVTVVDGSTSGVFALSPANPTMNSSGTQLAVGSYSLGASGTSIFTSPTGGTPNFNEIQVIGGLTVTPLQLSYSDLGITGVSQVYNGSVNMTNLSLTASSGVLPGDVVTVAGTGTFASKNVGINIPYTVGIALTGADSANYQINSGSSYTGTNGAITQLHSVTYTGPNTGGSWSNPSYWTITGTTDTGAIPDLSNVANVILPTGKSVVYDDSVQGPVTSAVANSGNLSFNLATNTTIPMSISGVGSVTVSGAGAITLTGNSSYTGETILQAGTSLIAGSNHAIGAGNITSNGTSANPASFSTSSSVVLPALNITGGSTKIRSDITTTGPQSYSGSVLIGASSGGTTTLASTNSNITFNGILDGVSNKSESLVINAGTGVVTIGDSVGSNYRLNNLTVTGSRIYILADILTAVVQTYNGSVYIGNASYLGRTPTVGFLFNNNYRGYFEYLAGGGVSASELSYLNSNSIYVRTMISEDPSITYNGSVNDTVANTHTLLAAAIASTSVPTSSGVNAINGAASINFNQSVGADAPLYSLNTQIRVNNTQSDSASSYIGTINLVDTVSTYSNQTYRANLMSARASTQPGSVTFSVWDPAANVSFNVPEQTVANSACSNNCGQINLQNPSSRDILTINGRTNFALDANLTGVNNWGNEYVQRNAIGYASPVTIPSIRPSNVSEINGGMLREVIDFHADQVQMAIATRISSRVLVGEPENIEITPLDSDKKSTLSNQLSAGTICTVDQFGDTQCEED